MALNVFILTLLLFEHQIDNGRRLAWYDIRLSLFKDRSRDHMQSDLNKAWTFNPFLLTLFPLGTKLTMVGDWRGVL